MTAAAALGAGACSVATLRPATDAASNDSPGTGDRDSSIAGSGGGGHASGGAAGTAPDGSLGGRVVVPDAAADGGPDVRADSAAADGRGDATDAKTDTGSDARGDAGSTTDVVPTCTACTAYGTPQALGPSPSVLTELSGLAASRVHPGLLYTHNDSGDSARFFAITQQATVAAEIHLSGATATDWEDISVGPCPAGSCVYIGDTGDNKSDRTQYVIYRVTEPTTLPSDGSVVTVASYESFPFVYPDGPHNAETLMVHPQTGRVFIVLKETGVPAPVYEMPLPLQKDTVVTLQQVATLAIPPAEGLVTDGAFHPCGDRALIRTTGATGLFELARLTGGTVPSIFGSTPVSVPVPSEPQGEAVTWALDGRSYFTASETVSGDAVPSLSRIACTSLQ
jgi:hypothetical protein